MATQISPMASSISVLSKFRATGTHRIYFFYRITKSSSPEWLTMSDQSGLRYAVWSTGSLLLTSLGPYWLKKRVIWAGGGSGACLAWERGWQMQVWSHVCRWSTLWPRGSDGAVLTPAWEFCCQRMAGTSWSAGSLKGLLILKWEESLPGESI